MAQHDCDMATAEGRARMLAQAKPLWSALPEGALEQVIAKAKALDMDDVRKQIAEQQAAQPEAQSAAG